MTSLFRPRIPLKPRRPHLWTPGQVRGSARETVMLVLLVV